MEKVVADTVAIFDNIPLRNSVDDPNELPEAVAVIVVDYDGVHPGSLVTGPLAPQTKSHINYGSFIRRICSIYGECFQRRVIVGRSFSNRLESSAVNRFFAIFT